MPVAEINALKIRSIEGPARLCSTGLKHLALKMLRDIRVNSVSNSATSLPQRNNCQQHTFFSGVRSLKFRNISALAYLFIRIIEQLLLEVFHGDVQLFSDRGEASYQLPPPHISIRSSPKTKNTVSDVLSNTIGRHLINFSILMGKYQKKTSLG
jgi:hypothetical protein